MARQEDKLRRALGRLIDGYAEGLIAKHEFEPRIAQMRRRIAQLEERLGAHMFEKLPSGYRLTAAGEEVLEFAEQMEAHAERVFNEGACSKSGGSGKGEVFGWRGGPANAGFTRRTRCPAFAVRTRTGRRSPYR